MSTHEPGLTARLRQLAHGPEYGPGSCAHNYVVFHEGEKTIYRCLKCGHTIR